MGAITAPAHWMVGAHLAKVVSVQDPQSLSRVQVQVLSPDADNEGPLWARVAVPFAGDNCGAFMIPNVDDEVLVVFAGNDPRYPIVVGSLWNGKTSVPETIGGSEVDRWTITGRNGTRIAIVEQSTGQEKVEIETPNGVKATLTDASGGSIRLEAVGNTLTMNNQGVSIHATSKFRVEAAQIEMQAGQVKIDTALASFTAMAKCEIMKSTTVLGSTYTPGAGNVW
jgi:uncharacterized protein involved in type VI secretion and phage assembly